MYLNEICPIPLVEFGLDRYQYKAILYEDLSIGETTKHIKIVDETNANLILRAATRFNKDSLQGSNFDILKNNIAAIKAIYSNTKIIGNVYWQVIARGERDDITGQVWTDQEVYDTMAFDPAKYNLPGITKCEIQCFDNSCTCNPGGYGDVRYGAYYIPDLSIPDVQLFYIHQVQRLLEAGCDGIWIDGPFINAYDISKFGGSTSYIQLLFDANLYIIEEIRKLRTKDGNIPMISTWFVGSDWISYCQNSPYWHNNFFDFVTIGNPNIDEIKTITAKQDYDKIINDVKNYHNNVPIITYIDWWWRDHPMWYFSQWHPKYTYTLKDCCHQDNITKRYNFQIAVLRYFTEFFKSKGIIWAYPILCPSCSADTCPGLVKPNSGTCCTKAYGQYYWYDALAPQFDTFDEIVRLMHL